MPYATTITKKGQITIPKPIREMFDLHSDSRVTVRLEKRKKIVIEPAPTILDIAGKFKPKKAYNAVTLRKMMEKYYERV